MLKRRWLFLILAATLLYASPSLAYDQEKMIDRQYDVGDGGTLEIDLGDSDVEVVPGSGGVHVEIFLEADNMDRARDYFERQHITVEHSGTTVRVWSEPERRSWDWRSWRDSPRILTRVSVPERFNADVRTSDGDVRIERLHGEVSLQTSDGDVIVGMLVGEAMRLKTSDGDVRITSLEAESVEIETSDGDLQIDEVTAGRIYARTSDGDVRAGRLRGVVELKTSDGDIRVEAVEGTSFSARTSDGDVEIDEIVADRSVVRTSDGSIRLRAVSGALEARGSDSEIDVELVKPGDVTISTSEGDISIIAPAGLPADLELHGDDVRVATGFDFEGRIEDESASGRINGGGPLLEARTSDGDVTLRTR